MTEPTRQAQSLVEILPGLFHYRLMDDRIGTESEAYALRDKERIVLIDPLPIAGAMLLPLGPVEAIVLASSSHQRSAWRLRRDLGAGVWAPRSCAGLEETPDRSYAGGDALPGGLIAIAAPGPSASHHVFHLALGPGVLFLTDLMLHDQVLGVRFITDDHMSDPPLARRSAAKLLERPFDILCFGHGRPILKGGRAAFQGLLEREMTRTGS